MFCPNCAQPVRDGAKFCEYCGFPLASIQMPTQVPAAAATTEDDFDPSKNMPVLLYGPPPEPVIAVETQPEPEPEPEPASEPEPEPVVAVEPDPIEAISTEPTIAVAAEPVASYQQPVQAQPTAVYPQAAQTQPTYGYQQPAQTQQAYGYQQPAQTQQAYGYQQSAQPQQTYAYQQPVQQPAYGYQQPVQQPTYVQASAPAQTEKTPFTKTVWFKILIGLIALLLVYGIVKAVSSAINIANVNNGSSSNSSSSGSSSDDDPFSIIDNIINPSSTDILDSEGNPTAYALLNLDGAEICDALVETGWTFDDDYLLWSSEDGNNAYYVCGPDDYEYTESDIRRMSANGGRDAAIMTVMLDDYDYDSFDEIVDKLIRVNMLDKYDAGEAMFLILETESGVKDFALLTYDSYSGLYRLDIANENAISCGYAEDFLGVYGTTLDDIWYDATGRSIAEG